MPGERPKVRLLGNTLQAMEIHKSKARHAPTLCLEGESTGQSDHFSQINCKFKIGIYNKMSGVIGQGNHVLKGALKYDFILNNALNLSY